MATQVGDRIMAIDVPGMKHGDKGTIRHIVVSEFETTWWGAWLWPDRPFSYPVLLVAGYGQWQNLSR